MGHLRGSLAIAASLATLIGCGGSGSGPRFSGETAAEWEVLTAVPPGSLPGLTDYSAGGKGYFFQLQESALYRYDGAFTPLASPPEAFDARPGPAWIGDKLYVLRNQKVFAYSITDNAWTSPLGGVPETECAQMTHDDDGNVWALETDEPYRIVKYDPAQNSVHTFPAGDLGEVHDCPRVAWDPLAKRLLVAPAWTSPLLFAFDPATEVVTPRASVPAADGSPGTGMGTAFCSDRSGHLYAAGDDGCSASATMFQYDTGSDAWERIPDVPFEHHGCNGACTVTDDGWLYFQAGGVSGWFSRLKLE